MYTKRERERDRKSSQQRCPEICINNSGHCLASILTKYVPNRIKHFTESTSQGPKYLDHTTAIKLFLASLVVTEGTKTIETDSPAPETIFHAPAHRQHPYFPTAGCTNCLNHAFAERLTPSKRLHRDSQKPNFGSSRVSSSSVSCAV